MVIFVLTRYGKAVRHGGMIEWEQLRAVYLDPKSSPPLKLAALCAQFFFFASHWEPDTKSWTGQL